MLGKQCKKRTSKIKFFTLVLFIIVLSWFFVCQYLNYLQGQTASKYPLSGEYNAIFCSMYPIDNFSEDDFVNYRGLLTAKSETPLENLSTLKEYMQTALASGNSINTIYLGLDPEQMWNNSGQNTDNWSDSLKTNVLSIVSAHPEIRFEVLLPAPMLTYWTEKDENTVDDVLTAYQRLIGDLDTYSNIVTYFFGGEYWLIGNSSNYTDSMTTNKLISQKILLYAFCDGAYSINSTAAQSTLESLRTIIQAQRLTPTQYPDFSGLDIIFFGDSIIGNYTGSSSVPGVVSGLSGAHTYNCGIGGVAAAKSTEAELDFPAMATAFITGDLSAIPTETPFRDAFHAYRENADSDNELCFIINYGLNDYFNGLPLSNPAELGDITTYAGALREGISLLQESYPDAHIILMGPTFSTAFSYGTEITSEKGSVLTDYVDTAQLVAEETNILFMNNYLNMGINKDNAALYLPDGTHLNESGRFLLAQHIIEKLHSATVQ